MRDDADQKQWTTKPYGFADCRYGSTDVAIVRAYLCLAAQQHH